MSERLANKVQGQDAARAAEQDCTRAERQALVKQQEACAGAIFEEERDKALRQLPLRTASAARRPRRDSIKTSRNHAVGGKEPTVVVVPYWEWQQIRGDEAAEVEYLRGKLGSSRVGEPTAASDCQAAAVDEA